MKKRDKKSAPQPRADVERDVALAIGLHRAAMRDRSAPALAEARTLYEHVLARAPRHPDALHFLGVLRHQAGDTDEAVALIRRSITEKPRHAEFHNNLGNVLREADRLDEAANAYRKAIELSPRNADAHSNLGTVLKAIGALDESARAYESALASDGKHVAAHHNLANVLSRLGRLEDAIRHYRTAIELDPLHRDARKLLGLALHHAGHAEEAVRVFREWLEREPGDAVASHLLAACSGTNVPGRASDAYVESAFDTMAATFDEHLKDLGYRAPTLVARALDAVLDASAGDLDVIDAGCGTGLCAAFLAPRARRLVGVDLSGGMLRRARALDAYHELVQGELTETLARAESTYDLVVSADTLCYFGDLRAMMVATSRALRAGGHLVYTVEKIANGVAADFVLNPHGRYAHAEAYLERVHAEAGLRTLTCELETLRVERSVPVLGFVVVCAKT